MPDESKEADALKDSPESKVAVSGTAKAVKREKSLSKAEQDNLLLVARKTRSIVEAYINSPLGADISQRHKRSTIQAVINGFTTRAVREACEASVVSREQRHRDFDLRDVVNILLFNYPKTQNTFRARKYRDHVQAIIEDMIRDCLDKKANGEL